MFSYTTHCTRLRRLLHLLSIRVRALVRGTPTRTYLEDKVPSYVSGPSISVPLIGRACRGNSVGRFAYRMCHDVGARRTSDLADARQ